VVAVRGFEPRSRGWETQVGRRRFWVSSFLFGNSFGSSGRPRGRRPFSWTKFQVFFKWCRPSIRGVLRPRLPAARVLSAMDRQDDDVFTDHPEVDSVRETIEERSPRVSACALKQQRVFNDVFNRVVKSRAKGSAEARLPRFVPLSRFECFRCSLRSKT